MLKIIKINSRINEKYRELTLHCHGPVRRARCTATAQCALHLALPCCVVHYILYRSALIVFYSEPCVRCIAHTLPCVVLLLLFSHLPYYLPSIKATEDVCIFTSRTFQFYLTYLTLFLHIYISKVRVVRLCILVTCKGRKGRC